MEEFFDKQGRRISREQIDGVTRHTVHQQQDNWEFGRPMETGVDLRSCIRNPRWKTDPSFRDGVIQAMKEAEAAGANIQVEHGGGGEVQVLERAMAAGNANADRILEQRENILAMFGDPRYAKSPVFRRQVQELIANSPESDAYRMELPGYRVEINPGTKDAQTGEDVSGAASTITPL